MVLVPGFLDRFIVKRSTSALGLSAHRALGLTVAEVGNADRSDPCARTPRRWLLRPGQNLRRGRAIAMELGPLDRFT
jgi:hypothetical protein